MPKGGGGGAEGKERESPRMYGKLLESPWSPAVEFSHV